MIDGATINGDLPPWRPDELGLPRAILVSLLAMGVSFSGIWVAAHHLPHVEKHVVPMTYVQIVQLPNPNPTLPLPKPPLAVPAPVPKPTPYPIVRPVSPKPTKIPGPAKHPVKHVAARKPPMPAMRPPPSEPSPPVSAPSQPMFDFAAYAASLRAPIRNLVHVSPAMRMLHLHGTSEIEFELDPSGRLVFAKVHKSSGSGLIDRSALDAVRRMHYPRFPGTASKVFLLPITISPDTGAG